MKSSIIDTIEKYETIIIHRHERPDPDAYGSQAGLGEMIKNTYPEKKVLLAGEEDESLNFLARLDDISDSEFEGALIIVCDTANKERICDQRYVKGDLVIKIDHHPNREPYGDLMWVDPEASSASEMIYELYLEGRKQGWELSDESARLLYAGIVADTGRFLYPSTTERTFNAAKELSQFKFDRSELYENMYKIPLNVAKFKGVLLQELIPRESGLAVFKITKEMLEKYELTADETQAFVGIAGDIEGIVAWVFFVEEDDVIRVRLRSQGPVINDVAFQFNGGGHPLASGAKVYSWDETEKMIEALDQVCLDFEQKE
ncbi:DHH family phosphoesterase [Halalkalibacillus sediminis]|uniref:DHH family phosphoesterase n=1 Tax=Halalkalibacillus sediminis TaxID=2018042 RepID=A0A2I0QY93_9BACI|nr:bifunctional oligoribonuclease/PAP phosphatase NrnA [Halalkalibacillus sediminis]PKR79279.1 DHH family phosphoesterase [Halalkalibacillus sediminis]